MFLKQRITVNSHETFHIKTDDSLLYILLTHFTNRCYEVVLIKLAPKWVFSQPYYLLSTDDREGDGAIGLEILGFRHFASFQHRRFNRTLCFGSCSHEEKFHVS